MLKRHKSPFVLHHSCITAPPPFSQYKVFFISGVAAAVVQVDSLEEKSIRKHIQMKPLGVLPGQVSSCECAWSVCTCACTCFPGSWKLYAALRGFQLLEYCILLCVCSLPSSEGSFLFEQVSSNRPFTLREAEDWCVFRTNVKFIWEASNFRSNRRNGSTDLFTASGEKVAMQLLRSIFYLLLFL